MKALTTIFSAAVLLLVVSCKTSSPVGSPRTDIPWLRVCRPEMSDEKRKRICEITATVQRAFNAVNWKHHTEFIAEVILEESDRPVVKEESAVIHSDRWHDLFGDDVNPFTPGSKVVIEVRGDPKDVTSLQFTIQKISPKQAPEPTPTAITPAAKQPPRRP
jgi:hypothetical protein